MLKCSQDISILIKHPYAFLAQQQTIQEANMSLDRISSFPTSFRIAKHIISYIIITEIRFSTMHTTHIRNNVVPTVFSKRRENLVVSNQYEEDVVKITIW